MTGEVAPMTPGQWVVVIIAGVIVGLILCCFVVEQINDYRASKLASKRARHETLLKEIADLERELADGFTEPEQ